MKYYGVMLDSARLTEKHSFYFGLLPYLAKWGYNTIWWHFTDDQGCSLKFDTRPELASRGAFSKQDIEEFISRANDYGIEVIPELESFGHTGFITGPEKYRHLIEAVEGSRFGAICPSNPETLEILEDLIREVSELFPSDYIHAGFDEVSFGSCPQCSRRLEKEKPWEIFAGHVEAVRNIIARHGKKMMMWGDHLTSEPKLADRIPRDVVICDWQYFDVDASSVAGLLEKRFSVICCPALTNFFKVIHPKESNLENMKEFAGIAANMQSAGVIGMMNTVWCPYRFIQGAVVHGIAVGAHIFRNAGHEEDNFSEEFAADYFATKNATDVGRAVRSLYAAAPELSLVKCLAPLNSDELEALSSMEIQQCDRMREQGTEIWTTLEQNLHQVNRNIHYYEDIMVTAEIIVGLALNGKDLADLFKAVTAADLLKGNGRDLQVHNLLRSLAERTRSLHARALKRWNAGRFEDDPDRDGRARIHPSDASILYRLKMATEFFEKLIPDTTI